jgi:hypothetical protein
LLIATRDLNKKPHRHLCIRDLVPYFVFWHNDTTRDCYVEGIRTFTDRLPYEIAEERGDEDYVAGLREKMNWFVEQADPQYWHQEQTEDGKHYKIWNDPPSANSEKRLRLLEEHAHLYRCLRLALWAQRSLETGALGEDLSLEEGLEEAQALDFDSLFESPAGTSDISDLHRKTAVAGVAYVVARYADATTWNDTNAAWCLDVLRRAQTTPLDVNANSYRGSILSMHPLVFAVHGFGALLLRNHEIRQCQSAILDFAVDPLEGVVEAIAPSAKLYASAYPDFYWLLFSLLVTKCIFDEGSLPDHYSACWDEVEAARNIALFESAEAKIGSGVPPVLPDIPMPWIERPDLRGGHGQEALGYARNPVIFDWHMAEKAILPANIDVLLNIPGQRVQIMTLVEQLVAMTIQEIVPPFAASGRDHNGNTPFEWVFSFFHWLGGVASRLSPAETQAAILKPLFATDNETALLAMQSFVPSYLGHAIIPPATITEDSFTTWDMIANWILENKEGEHIHGRYVDRKFTTCVFALLFCFSGDFRPLVCLVNEGWPDLHRFVPIIERAAGKFGANTTLFLGIINLFKCGGLDLFPNPALAWLTSIAEDRKQDQDFWRSNGDETVELLKLVLEKKTQHLTAAHRDAISLISDILVDNGVRGAGFMQQDQLRARLE